MVISDKERFEQEDHGGAIYILPAQRFGYDESSGLGVYEWTSKDVVTPITHINFASSLDAMQVAFEMWLLKKQNNQIISKNE